jgi:hypothetical protein
MMVHKKRIKVVTIIMKCHVFSQMEISEFDLKFNVLNEIIKIYKCALFANNCTEKLKNTATISILTSKNFFYKHNM